MASAANQFILKVRELQDRGAMLAAVEALEDASGLQLTYFFVLDGKNERIPFTVENGTCPSLIQLYGSADYMERNLFQRYRTKFIGNPNLEHGL